MGVERAWLLRLLVVVLCAGLAGAGLAQDPDPSSEPEPADPQLVERQRAIEAGSDLGSAAQRVLFQARSRQDAQDFTAAVQVVEDWLTGHPDREHHLLRFNLGVSYLGLDNAEVALENLQRAVDLEPDFARAWLRLGETAYGLGRYVTAAEAFEQGYRLSPRKHPEILYYSGAAWLLGEQPARSVDILDRLLTGYAGQAKLDWYRALIAAADAADQPGRARVWLDRLLEQHGSDPEAWDLSYRFAAGNEQYRQAAIALTVTGYLRPLTAGELWQLGDLYSVIGVPLQAARYYERSLEAEGTGAEAGDPEAAAEDPESSDARPSAVTGKRERVAEAWLAAHEHDQARRALDRALAEQPTARLYTLLGDLEYLQENHAAALAAFTAATGLDPGFGRGWLMMGYCALELDRTVEARRALEKAREFPDQAGDARMLMERL
jgi:tetratricopeptide (TPR) repeat protein